LAFFWKLDVWREVVKIFAERMVPVAVMPQVAAS